MTLTAELTAQLQAAWQAAGRDSTRARVDDQDCPPIEREPMAGTSTQLRQRCVSHFDSDDWIRALIPDRPGWIRTRCGRCGVFIGDAPATPKQTLATQTRTATESTGGIFSAITPDSG
jgi:hypothetical protein